MDSTLSCLYKPAVVNITFVTAYIYPNVEDSPSYVREKLDDVNAMLTRLGETCESSSRFVTDIEPGGCCSESCPPCPKYNTSHEQSSG